MNRDEATSIVLAEAYAMNGLVMLAQQGDDPGFQRMETLISAVKFLAEDLCSEDTLDRMLVAALFELGAMVPEELQRVLTPTSDARCSLFRQSVELQVAVFALIQSWENWPSEEDLVTRQLSDPPVHQASADSADEEFEGYRVGDITYCIVSKTEAVFPVKVIRLGFNAIEVEALSTEICRSTCEAFLEDRLNRCFQSPSLPSNARFGGHDERPVNAARQSGPELRLLPSHYATTTGNVIRQRHQEDPNNWPLPTGKVFDQWFKGR